MSFTAVQICANALIRLGATPIQSFDEGTSVATTCETIYNMKKPYMLSVYPWRFTKKFMQLSQISIPPAGRWKYQYTLPADKGTSGLPTVFTTDSVGATPIQNYEIFGDVLMTNQKEIWVEYQAIVDESFWEYYFVELMTYVMMDELCFNITDNATLKTEIHQITYGIPSEFGIGGVYGKAMALDSRDNPTVLILDDILMEARFGNGAT